MIFRIAFSAGTNPTSFFKTWWSTFSCYDLRISCTSMKSIKSHLDNLLKRNGLCCGLWLKLKRPCTDFMTVYRLPECIAMYFTSQSAHQSQCESVLCSGQADWCDIEMFFFRGSQNPHSFHSLPCSPGYIVSKNTGSRKFSVSDIIFSERAETCWKSPF